ncbi:MAG: HAD-IIA family hydrolase [Actinomycetota bacterium]|nr:HAD-IIA family hydrolase [Actinomycetota bacterium]
MTSPLRDRFDALLFDLDGVVYVGRDPVAYAAAAIADAREAGLACAFVTNNAARSPQDVATHLAELGIPAGPDDVVTSPQAAVTVLADYVPPGSRVLVIGGGGIDDALAHRGYVPVRSLADVPAAVMQGFSPDLCWADLAEASYAVRAGLPWIATNPDLTFPTARGLAPGNGSLVQVVATASGRQPDAVAGKPEPPLLHEAIVRTGARRPLMIGDRLDTDIAAGPPAGIPTLLVLTGVSTLDELFGAAPGERPDYIGGDLRVLAEPYPVVAGTGVVTCGAWQARLVDDAVHANGPDNRPWDGVRCVATLCWQAMDAGRPARWSGVARTLTDLAQALGE